MEDAFESWNGLSDCQHGFKERRSIVDAINMAANTAAEAIEGKRCFESNKKYCLVITRDNKNTSSVAGLQERKVLLYLINIVANYFTGRNLWYETEEGCKKSLITGEVLQGPVLGPTLCDAM